MTLDTKLIAFEGDDGVGKTTLARECEIMLIASGKSVLRVCTEILPPYAKNLRDIIVSDAMEHTSTDVRALMFSSWLLNIQEELIQPNWGKYDFIIIDRTYLSTMVYQRDSIVLDHYFNFLAELLPMDILVYLECADEVGLKRIVAGRGAQLDVFERTSTKHEIKHRKLQYNRLIDSLEVPHLIRLDANPAPTDVAAAFKELLFDIMAQ